MSFFPMLCENYNGMSQSFFYQYKDADNYLRSLNSENWDYLSHTPEENQKFTEAYTMRLNAALAAVVFQALAIEAFVNLYGAQKVGEEKYYSEYESKGATTIGKLKKICLEAIGKAYPANNRSYSRLISLLEKRDRIVHTKPRSLKVDSENDFPQTFEEYLEQAEFVFKNIDEEMQSYGNLKKIIQEIDGSEKDLVEENIEVATHAAVIAVLQFLPPDSNIQDFCDFIKNTGSE